MMYTLRFLPRAARYFKKIKEKPLKKAFEEALGEVAKDPYCGERKTGDLAGVYCRDVYYRGTNYEIAYAIRETEEQLVIIVLAGTRENFYADLKQYIRTEDL